MRRFMRTAALSSIFVLGALLTSCDSAERLSAPADGPAFSSHAGVQRLSFDGSTGVIGQSASVEMSSSGGELVIAHNGVPVVELIVRGGTVKKPTTFSAKITSNFVVELTATTVADGTSAVFRKPVFLRINTAYLNVEPPFTNLGIAELLPNGKLEPTNSWLETDDGWTFVVGELTHFSGWVPIQD